MRSVVADHGLLPESLRVETWRVSISVATGAKRPRCPVCGRGSSRQHSRYLRTVSDLPWHGISVALEARARRLFCDEASCERRIFCERLPEVAARARKTSRLEEGLLARVLELGGRAGARLAAELGLLVGRPPFARASGPRSARWPCPRPRLNRELTTPSIPGPSCPTGPGRTTGRLRT